ncbi:MULTISPECIES: hypothetical protein [Acidiplasma]|jgi:hypothetical protein|uniref:Uncharacterized protein n=2 Tax=Acidiplasma TaxID=507753 RepID=A0A0Q0RLN5_9ARCH|nr:MULTISPECIES: hypothetical protein [Acidiplasma]KJE49151.1 hypothetical protein TZ01_03410 [Acidiplasma sp. MBA-1]KPV46943.1 hypothetical protein SE19_03275 [Acidiplasma aeolicum]KQB34912.1 hypothetical protein AOG54_03470 [Acidiplasma aeolicum]KQB36507.1 hypothetical protein AOG55_03840 [Acidiplasma cupricumulans]WMT54912.1 MAG: hypothetical protein RE470_08355 [Acidiplasma sp.]
MTDNNENTENEIKAENISSDENVESTQVINEKPKGNNKALFYIELGILLVAIILIGIASLQFDKIGHVKINGFTEVAFPLGLIFIAFPSLFYFEKLRHKNPAIVILIIFLIGIILIYVLLGPYKMFTVHLRLLGAVMAEYIIGFFMLMHHISYERKHIIKE